MNAQPIDRHADRCIDDYVDELLDDALAGRDPGPSDVASMPAASALPDSAPPRTGPAATPAAVVPPPAPAPAPIQAPAPPPAPLPSPAPARIGARAHATRWLRVAVGADSYALELLRVQEVVRVAPIVRMRGAAPAVLGVMNLRGRIVPVYDLGRWLGSAAIVAGERARIVVVEHADELIGVLVAAVDDVATLGHEHIEPPLAGTAGGAMGPAIVGIARVGATPTVLLDANALFG